jgi:anti-anti-sigma factor
MAFNAVSETVKSGVVKIILSGELDANSAGVFRSEIENASSQHPKHLALVMQDVSYMASAGVRVLVFAKQKMGSGVDIFVIAPQDSVLETLQLTGMDQALYVLDKYDAARIENV